MSERQPVQATTLSEALLGRLTRRGWAITDVGEAPGGYWFGRAEFLRGGPDEGGPDFLFSVREPTREACMAKLRELVAQEREKGTWTEIARD